MSASRPAVQTLLHGRWWAAPRWRLVATLPPPAPCRATACTRRQFQTTAEVRSKRKSRFRNITAAELGLLDPEKRAEYRQEKFPDYTPEDYEELRKKYSEEQLEAIRAGEAAIDPDDIIIQGRLRDDVYRPDYIEDFTKLDPRMDLKPQVVEEEATAAKPVKFKWQSIDQWVDEYGARMANMMEKKTDQQITRAMIRAFCKVKASHGVDLIDLTEDELKDLEKNPDLLQKYLAEVDEADAATTAAIAAAATANEPPRDAPPVPEEEIRKLKASVEELNRAVDDQFAKEIKQLEELDDEALMPNNFELIEHGPAGISQLDSVEASELGKVPGAEGVSSKKIDADDGVESTAVLDRLKKIMGMKLPDLKSLYTKTLVLRFVSNQTRLGKVRSASVVAIAGNGNGRLGLGMAKSTEPSVASEVARALAVRNMKPIPRYENRTIYGNLKGKLGGTTVELSARPPGFGLRCPHRIFEMCRAAGLHDMSASIGRSKSPMNSVKAAYYALVNQRDPEEMAIGRGCKLVDVRKVYYGGTVY